MALAKKGSRLITVDGVVYRWRVGAWPDCPCCNPLRMTYAIERVDRKGVVLVEYEEPGVPIVPSIVATSIRAALRTGWPSTQPGHPFYLDSVTD